MTTREAILRTIIYYDLFDHALTPAEVSLLCEQATTEEAVAHALPDIPQLTLLDGYLILPDRSQLIAARQQADTETKAKLARLHRLLPWLIRIPFLRMIATSGSLARGSVDADSDLDVFIVTESHRLFTARFLLTVVSILLGAKRDRHGHHTRDRLCFNHFVVEDQLYLQPHNLYTARLYGHFTPVYGDDTYDRLVKLNKDWLRRYIPSYPWINRHQIISNRYPRLERLLSGPFGDRIENWLKKLQLRRIDTSIPGVFASDRELTFHNNPQQPRILAAFAARCREFNIDDSC